MPRTILQAASLLSLFLSATAGLPAGDPVSWHVVLRIHQVYSTSGRCDGNYPCNDCYDDDDLFVKVWIADEDGNVFFDQTPHQDDVNLRNVDWRFPARIPHGEKATIKIALYDDDGGGVNCGGDDLFDINPGPGRSLTLEYWPHDRTLDVGGTVYTCAGELRRESTSCDGSAASDDCDYGGIVFSVNSSIDGTFEDDTDADGLLDVWEECGLDVDEDGTIDVDLPAMGSDPYRPDVFVEIDWLYAGDHSHAPWLPSLMNAWHELDVARVTNPDRPDGSPTRSGVALHVDVGRLYEGYAVDFDADGTAEIEVPFGSGPMSGMGPGDIDLDEPGDGIADIGDLGALGLGTAGGGNHIVENATNRDFGPDMNGDFFEAGSTFANLRALHFEETVRGRVFRYCLFADRVGGKVGGVTKGAPNFMVYLAAADPASYDLNRDGVGDRGASPLPGPSLADGVAGGAMLPSNGSIPEHTATFLHELGHSLGLHHGGPDAEPWGSTNLKPNYLSIMNYRYGWNLGIFFDGDRDGLNDAVDADFNHDGIPDDRRVCFSTEALGKPSTSPTSPPSIDEQALIEDGGLGATVAPFGYAVCSTGPRRSCSHPGVIVATRTFPADGGDAGFIDWDGDCSLDLAPVSMLAPGSSSCLAGGLTSPVIPPGFPLDLNEDCDPSSPPWAYLDPLFGHDDNDTFANVLDLAENIPMGEEAREFRRSLPRVAPVFSAGGLKSLCHEGELAHISFDELRPGTALTSQHVTDFGVSFVADELAAPTVVGRAARLGRRTASNAMSLSNQPAVGVDLGASDLEEGLRVFFTRYGTAGHSAGLVCGPVSDRRDARVNWGGPISDLDEEDRRFYFEVTEPALKSRDYLRIAAAVYDDPALPPGTRVELRYTNDQAGGPTDVANVFATHPHRPLLGGTGGWITLEWTLVDAGFSSLQYGRADFLLAAYHEIAPSPPTLIRTAIDAVNVQVPELDPNPLTIHFEEPRRLVGVHLGSVLPAIPGEASYAILRAYDTDGFLMEPPVASDLHGGIVDFLGVGAIYADRPIAAVQIEFGSIAGGGREPVHIDSLLVSARKKDEEPLPLEKRPEFGDHDVTVTVRAELRALVAKATPPGIQEETFVTGPLAGVPVQVNQTASHPTDFLHTQREGTWLELDAPPVVSGHRFVHWRVNGAAQLGEGQHVVKLYLVNDLEATAVYEGESDVRHDGARDGNTADDDGATRTAPDSTDSTSTLEARAREIRS